VNILVVMADQLVPFLTSPYGDPVARTPNLQRLADAGVRYGAAYTPYPLCSPARAAFMTGDYASRHGCYDNASILPAAPHPEAEELRTLILEQFDPDAIARSGADSVARRDLIARAMARTTTRWDYSPVFDATKQYVR
jgi:sulfatase-like protein